MRVGRHICLDSKIEYCANRFSHNWFLIHWFFVLPDQVVLTFLVHDEYKLAISIANSDPVCRIPTHQWTSGFLRTDIEFDPIPNLPERKVWPPVREYCGLFSVWPGLRCGTLLQYQLQLFQLLSAVPVRKVWFNWMFRRRLHSDMPWKLLSGELHCNIKV